MDLSRGKIESDGATDFPIMLVGFCLHMYFVWEPDFSILECRVTEEDPCLFIISVPYLIKHLTCPDRL